LKQIAALLGLFYLLNAYSVDSYWLSLLHYKKNITGGYESLIDDKNFFISKDGKKNPKKELLASIKLIKSVPKKFACRFPLRFEYLNSKYSLSDFNIKSCEKLQKYLNDINAQKAVLVFADADINKPASMFGHTFIRIDTKDERPVLSSAVNYAAHVTDTNGILFAFKGIFGFYKAYYSLMPYYEKLKQYSDKDNRDLWEYGLKLSKNDVRRMVLHIWELKDIYSDYYFFSENCSYNILFLIEVAKPGINVTDGYFLTVIPLDTVKDLKKKGLITSYGYRPSLVTQIETIAKPVRDKKLIVKIALGKTDPQTVINKDISEEEKARILDAGVRYLEYLSKKRNIKKSEYTKRFLSILKARSKVGYVSNYKFKTPFNPVNAHDSKKITLSSRRFYGQNSLIFGLRMAYHTLNDPIEGYKLGSSLAFGNFMFRYERQRLKIEKIGLVEIESLSKRDVFFKPVSWKVNVGFYTKRIKGKNKTVFEINPGGGFTYASGKKLFYTLLQSDLNTDGAYKNGYSLGAGFEAGGIVYLKKHAFMVKSGAFRYFSGDCHTFRYLKTEYRYVLSRKFAFDVKYGIEKDYETGHTVEAGMFYYF